MALSILSVFQHLILWNWLGEMVGKVQSKRERISSRTRMLCLESIICPEYVVTVGSHFALHLMDSIPFSLARRVSASHIPKQGHWLGIGTTGNLPSHFQAWCWYQDKSR